MIEKTRQNALFLSVVAQFNGQTAITVSDWFRKLIIVSGLSYQSSPDFFAKRMKNLTYKKSILDFLQMADLGIDEISYKEKEIDLSSISEDENTPREIRSMIGFLTNSGQEKMMTIEVNCAHKKYSSEGKDCAIEYFSLDEEESEGTQKIFHLADPLIRTLKSGRTILIDEFDSRLHPAITRNLAKLFNSSQNSNNAQMIAASHDACLLTKDIFRRDQLWFTEKNRVGATNLYALSDFKTGAHKKVRNDASFRKDYMSGKYGAVPFLSNFDFFRDFDGNEHEEAD